MGEKSSAYKFQPRNVGTKAILMPLDFNRLMTDSHQAGVLRPASKADTTRRPSLSLYAAGLPATEAMIWTTELISVFSTEISGSTIILKRESTAWAAASMRCKALLLLVAS